MVKSAMWDVTMPREKISRDLVTGVPLPSYFWEALRGMPRTKP